MDCINGVYSNMLGDMSKPTRPPGNGMIKVSEVVIISIIIILPLIALVLAFGIFTAANIARLFQ